MSVFLLLHLVSDVGDVAGLYVKDMKEVQQLGVSDDAALHQLIKGHQTNPGSGSQWVNLHQMFMKAHQVS